MRIRHAPGQALTELALLLPTLAFILMGVLDLGRAYHTQVAASNAARVGILFAQQVASPRMMDCNPGTTCLFITVQDIINTVKQESQGGIDTAHAQVGVCLQHVATCPITDTTEAVASDEAITVTVSVPFDNITPFVHLSLVSGEVSGRTFPFEPVIPTSTPGGPTSTATPTVTPTSTATGTPTSTPTGTPTPTWTVPAGANTPTPAPTGTPTGTATPTFTPVTGTPTTTPSPTIQPIPYVNSGPSFSQCTNASTNCTNGQIPKSIAISWGTNQPFSGNAIYINGPDTNNTWARSPYTAAGGTSASILFTSKSQTGVQAWQVIKRGTYLFYLQASSTGGSSYYPNCAPACDGSGAYPTFDVP